MQFRIFEVQFKMNTFSSSNNLHFIMDTLVDCMNYEIQFMSDIWNEEIRKQVNKTNSWLSKCRGILKWHEMTSNGHSGVFRPPAGGDQGLLSLLAHFPLLLFALVCLFVWTPFKLDMFMDDNDNLGQLNPSNTIAAVI